jgi:hypothetical protein
MPTEYDKVLPKFDPDKSRSLEDHLNIFFLDTHLPNVQHEDVVCRIFPYAFSCKESTWYFIFPPGSITEWDDFERLFIGKFGERKMTSSMHKELGAINMDKKEKAKDFNQRFLNVLIKFPHDVAPTQCLEIEYYTIMLTPSIAIFVKRDKKNKLKLSFDEAKTVERELYFYEHQSHTEETKTTGKRPLLLTKPPEKEPKDIDSVVK